MKKRVLFFVLPTIIFLGCEQKKNYVNPETNGGKSNFFPVTQYLLGQIKDLDTLPVTPLKVTTVNGKADSIWLKRDAIRSFTKPFINSVIDSITSQRYFSEKSFLDQTINAFTFSYDPVGTLPDSIEVKRWDVYVDAVTQQVSRIFIVKQNNNNTPAQTIQLIWKPGAYCKITTITEGPGEAPKVREEKLIWNFND